MAQVHVIPSAVEAEAAQAPSHPHGGDSPLTVQDGQPKSRKSPAKIVPVANLLDGFSGAKLLTKGSSLR